MTAAYSISSPLICVKSVPRPSGVSRVITRIGNMLACCPRRGRMTSSKPLHGCLGGRGHSRIYGKSADELVKVFGKPAEIRDMGGTVLYFDPDALEDASLTDYFSHGVVFHFNAVLKRK